MKTHKYGHIGAFVADARRSRDRRRFLVACSLLACAWLLFVCVLARSRNMPARDVFVIESVELPAVTPIGRVGRVDVTRNMLWGRRK